MDFWIFFSWRNNRVKRTFKVQSLKLVYFEGETQTRYIKKKLYRSPSPPICKPKGWGCKQ
jgi:hypothetical protein